MHFTATLAVLAFILLSPAQALAFGSKRKDPPRPPAPAETQAYPTRDVAMGKLRETTFMLPDGKTKIDMSVYLPSLVLTELAQTTTKLRATQALTENPESQPRFVFVGGISSFEASAFSGSITFGYKPGVGDIAKGTTDGIEGTVRFNIGSLGMDFYVIDTQRSNQVVAVGNGSAVTGGAGLKVDLNFGAIKTPADFVYNSPMTAVFKTAARNAIKKMAGDSRTNFLMDWAAAVSVVNCDRGLLFFNSGARDDIKVGNLFTVYDDAGMRLGEARVTEAQHDQSAAVFKNDPNGKLIGSARAGDTVKIYFK